MEPEGSHDGEPLVAVRIIVTGRVQGVGFRWCALEEGRRLGVRGWVRNLRDGSVEASVEGTSEQVGAMSRWLRKGPRGAAVKELTSHPREPEGVQGFEILGTV